MQSNNLHLIQWFGRGGGEAAVSAHFTPREWWELGPDRIVWEMQRVYENFIRALEVRPRLASRRDHATPAFLDPEIAAVSRR
jgi:hypothetical protein